MRAAAATVAALMLLWLVVAALLLALGGCSPRVAAAEPSSTASLRHCFRVALKATPGPAIYGICSESWPRCEALRELAMRQGARVGLQAVGGCR